MRSPSVASPEFKTSDLPLASYLSTIGKSLLRVEAVDAVRKAFVFSDVSTTDVQDYLRGKAVNGRQLLENHRALKKLVVRNGE